jgi:hypothetical protein
MVPMLPPPQPSLEPDVTPEEVIEFGTEPARRRHSGLALALARDRRTVPLLATLAAVAAFASLVSEWQVTTMDATTFASDSVGDKMIPADLADLGAAGTGYLVALFPLVTAVVLTMFGPVAGRRYARLAGLSVGGTLFALLLAMTVTLGEQSRVISRLYTEQIEGGEMTVAYGRGLWCALFAVVAALTALYLPGPDGPEPPTAWFRQRRDQQTDPAPEEPFELTVSSTQPFSSPDDDRDRKYRSGRPGISE